MMKRCLGQDTSMTKPTGKIVIQSGIDVWRHELRTADALCAAGYGVTFIERKEGKGRSSADVEIDGFEWEIKSPISSSLKNVQKTLRKALHQSCRIVYDSQRVKNLTDAQIERELRKQVNEFKSIKRVIFVDKKRSVIDIK